MQERVKKMITKHILCYKNVFKKQKHNKSKSKSRLKNMTTDRTLTGAPETGALTERDREQLNSFERKVYGRISGPVYGNGNENCRILTNKEIYAGVKKPTVIETVRLNRLRWFGHVQRRKWNSQKGILYEFGKQQD